MFKNEKKSQNPNNLHPNFLHASLTVEMRGRNKHTWHWSPALCVRTPPSGNSTQNPFQASRGSRWRDPPSLAKSRKAGGTVTRTKLVKTIAKTLRKPSLSRFISHLPPSTGQLFVGREIRRWARVLGLANEHGGRQVKPSSSSNGNEELEGLRSGSALHVTDASRVLRGEMYGNVMKCI